MIVSSSLSSMKMSFSPRSGRRGLDIFPCLLRRQSSVVRHCQNEGTTIRRFVQASWHLGNEAYSQVRIVSWTAVASVGPPSRALPAHSTKGANTKKNLGKYQLSTQGMADGGAHRHLAFGSCYSSALPGAIFLWPFRLFS